MNNEEIKDCECGETTCFACRRQIQELTTNQTKSQIREEWEDKFEDELGSIFYRREVTGVACTENKEKVKSFIDELLKSQREELVKYICIMKEPMPSANDHYEYNRGMRDGVQLIRNAVINLIKDK